MTGLPLIGLIGRKRSGKDTVAGMLADRAGYEGVAFADPLRDMVAAIDPIVGHTPEGGAVHYTAALGMYGYEAAKDLYPEVRRVLQTTGTDGVRDVLGDTYGLRYLLDGLDVWPAIAADRIAAAHAFTRFVDGRRVDEWSRLLAFTDVRFPNEADLIRQEGGVLVRVARPSLPISDDEHISETALDAYREDYTLVNDGSLRDLAVAVDSLLVKLRS